MVSSVQAKVPLENYLERHHRHRRQGDAPNPQENDDSKSCCTVRKCVFLTALLLAMAGAGGVILWQFLPDNQKDDISRAIEDTAVGFRVDENAQVPPPTFQFMRCTDPNRCCNGLTSNCDLLITDVMYAGIHNAQAAAQNGFRISSNHLYKLEASLDYGYRAINLDIGECDGEIKLVHGLCKLGTRDPYEVFSSINDWLDSNPTEIILIPIQIDNNAGGGEASLSEIYNILLSIPGFTNKLWSKGESQPNQWPTMQELVEANRRILMFTYNGESCNDPSVLCPPGFMDWFEYAAETQYSFSSADEVRDVARSCEITRGRPRAQFFAVNNFVTLPSLKTSAEILNTREFLEDHIASCSELNGGLDVNVVFIDYWSQGELPQVVQFHNEQLARNMSNETSDQGSLRKRFLHHLPNIFSI